MIDLDQSKEIVRDLLNKSYGRLKQELLGENEEFLDRVLRQYRARVARHSWKHAQKWCKWDDDGPVLMPDFTRIYYRKGRVEILLQELAPQIRLLKFKGALAARANSSAELSQEEKAAIHHFSVALPYVVFIFKFVDGMFSEVRCGFSDRPLKRLDERPLRPYLSNLDSTLKVCLGLSFDRSKLIKDRLAQQTAYVLDHFWHSAYSDEWSAHYWDNKSHFAASDQRLASLQNWQDASHDNPLFVVEDVQWLRHSEENFGDMIVKMFEDDGVNRSLLEDLYKELVDSFFDEVKKTVRDNVSAVGDRILEQENEALAVDLLQKLDPNYQPPVAVLEEENQNEQPQEF